MPQTLTTSQRKISVWVTATVVLLVGAAVMFPLIRRYRTITLRGAVIRKSDDANKESPIADTQVTASDGTVVAWAKSDVSGAFRITLRRALISRHSVTLSFRHPDYKPIDIPDPIGNQLYVVGMVPTRNLPPVQTDKADVRIANVAVRYTVKTGAEIDIGSGVKTFQIANKGNVPCNGRPPCSPDGKWKAATGSASLDAGPDNEFRNGRVSCIAGPCPFTKIVRDDFSHGGRTISVTALDWSDATTFLLQAEAVRHMLTDNIRRSYPVIFDHTLNFSLPASAEGTCIEAEVDGTPIVFPIGPNLSLSWAGCETQTEADNNKLYRCELKPGYVFR